MGRKRVVTILKIPVSSGFWDIFVSCTLEYLSTGSRGIPLEFFRDHGQILPGNGSRFTVFLTSDLPHGIIDELLYCTGIMADFFCD